MPVKKGYKRPPRWWRSGPKPVPLTERYVAAPNGCWNFSGRLSSRGYGMLKWQSKNTYAHRLMYVQTHGQIPDGLWVLHHCDNPQCINPEHLYAGTPSDNAKDRENRGRGNQRYGERKSDKIPHINAARIIRYMYKTKKGGYRKIGALFGISASHTRNIVTGKCWKENQC